MEKHYEEFVKNLYKFISDLNRYTKDEGTKKILEVFDKLDMGKVMLRYLNTLREDEENIKSRNEDVFKKDVIIFPGVNLKNLWTQLSDKQKEKVWTYLQILYIQSELVLNFKESVSDNTNKNKTITTMIDDVKEHTDDNKQIVVKEDEQDEFNNLGFNPFVGIGGDSGQGFTCEQMYSGLDNLEDDQPSTPGLGALAGMFGVDKMINIEELSNQLKNMDKEEIDKATNNIKSLLGTEEDENTTRLISDMLTNITDELKKDDISKGNPLDNIIKIAETVASKMKPKLDENNIDMQNLWNSTQSLATQCKDEEGNELFSGANNPFNMLNQMMGMAQNMNDGNPNGQPMNEQDMMKNASNMLNGMGLNMNNMDFNNMNLGNFDLGNMMNQMSQGNFGQNNTRSQGKKTGKKGVKGGKKNGRRK